MTGDASPHSTNRSEAEPRPPTIHFAGVTRARTGADTAGAIPPATIDEHQPGATRRNYNPTEHHTMTTLRQSILAAATALAAIAGPVLAQEYDMTRFQPEYDMSRGGYVPIDPPAYVVTLPDPHTAAPMFYSGSTPYGMFTGNSSQAGNTRTFTTYGPGGRVTICTQTFSGGQSTVTCF
jgi:hypothetical protein